MTLNNGCLILFALIYCMFSSGCAKDANNNESAKVENNAFNETFNGKVLVISSVLFQKSSVRNGLDYCVSWYPELENKSNVTYDLWLEKNRRYYEAFSKDFISYYIATELNFDQAPTFVDILVSNVDSQSRTFFMDMLKGFDDRKKACIGFFDFIRSGSMDIEKNKEYMAINDIYSYYNDYYKNNALVRTKEKDMKAFEKDLLDLNRDGTVSDEEIQPVI